ncbi:MAG TPA: nucleoside recognition domain-containing protein [Candidatus Thermoplasmatota archaeon]|nr:nucleoside recognition domain-containing protein [Candidatus Thermoplasmatota archaeon]
MKGKPWGVIGSFFKELGKETMQTALPLFTIMIPVSIFVKLLDMVGGVTIAGEMIAPVMNIVGLPGEMGLVWASAMITNIYGGLIVFISVAENLSLTTADVTVLTSMILVAHSLFVEVTIAKKAGVRVWFTLFLRIGGAILFGWILNLIFRFSQILQDPAVTAWKPESKDGAIITWISSQLQNYALIFCVIFLLLLLMNILKRYGILNKINSFLEPGLEVLGMSKKAAPLTIIGLTLGISYGGGLIIKQARSGILSAKDSFLSVSLMGLSHSLIEDTLLMLTLGGSIIGILLGRVVFTIVIMVLLIQFLKRLSRIQFQKYFYD